MLTQIPTPETATCTIPFAVTGPCGAPAVISFTASDGRTFHECADHSLGTAGLGGQSRVAVGSSVTVVHIGVEKIGTVTAVQGSRALVRVPVGRGRTASTKVISRPVAEIGVRP